MSTSSTGFLDDAQLEASPEIDNNVLALFPKDTRVISKTPHGTSQWTVTSRLEIELADGTRRVLFLKVIEGDDPGKWMMHGEFETMKALYTNQPSFTPEPIGWNNYELDPHSWFFLCSFHDFSSRLVDPERFTEKLATLHQDSISPNGKFGFHVPTSIANEEWSDSWEECFVKLVTRLLDMEVKVWGPDDELASLSSHLLEVVIPRLLRPLTAEGRTLRPCLVHGDLWYGNAGTDKTNQEPLIFDGQAMYAHNEYELGDWYQARNKFDTSYYTAYHSRVPVSVPKEDFRDRNVLYSLKYDIQAAIMFTESPRFRVVFMESLRVLARRLPGPYSEYPRLF